MNPKEQLEALLKELRTIIDTAEAEARGLTEQEAAKADQLATRADELKAQIERGKKAQALMDRIGGMKSDTDPTSGETTKYVRDANGHHYIQTTGGAGVGTMGAKGYLSVTTPKGAKAVADALAAKIATSPAAKAVVAQTPITLTPASPIELGKVPTSLLAVMAVTEHDSPVYRYPRQTMRENNAAVVAPGGTKPESKLTTELVPGELKVIAHRSEPVDEYVLKDAEALSRFIDAELRYMLLQKIEAEVLNGDGTATHLNGILNVSGVQVQAFDTDPLTTLRMAALKAENAGHEASVFALHPLDWAKIETTRNTSGNFDLGTAVNRAEQKLWGTQVVTSNLLTPGEAVSLDLNVVGLNTDTHGIQVRWFDVDEGSTNQVRARCEGRFGVSVYQPLGIVKATIQA